MSKVCSQNHGYTIVETLIFLTVTGLLFASAIFMIGGQQAKTEFIQGVRELNSQIQDTINDVATGYYYNNQSFSCTYNPTGPLIIPSATDTQGTNNECIFIGRVISFGENSTDGDRLYTIFNVVGHRLTGSAPDSPLVTNLVEAKPTPLSKRVSAGSIPDTHSTAVLPGGLRVKGMSYNGISPLGAVGFFTTFSSYSTPSVLNSGAQSTTVVPILGSDWQNQGDSRDVAQTIFNNAATSPQNPSGGVRICFKSASTDQHAFITIGGVGKLTTKVDIESGPCP